MLIIQPIQYQLNNMRNKKGQFIKGHKERIGIKHTQEVKDKIKETKKGKPNGRLGAKHTTEAIKKIKEARKKQGNNVWNKGKKLDYKVWNKGLTKENHKSLKIISDKKNGKSNPMWQGGISFEKYTVDWTETLRRSIRERDKYVCQICGKPQGDKALAVHHIDYDKKNCNPVNLISLCHSCHTKTNSNRNYWIKYFYEKFN